MNDVKKLGKALIIIIAVLLIPITLTITVKLHQEQKEKESEIEQKNAVILLTEIEKDYYSLNDMLVYFSQNYESPAIKRELENNNLERASTIFMRRGVPREKLSGYFAWTFITNKYEILHKNIVNYNNKVLNDDDLIKDVDDIPRVVGKFKGSI